MVPRGATALHKCPLAAPRRPSAWTSARAVSRKSSGRSTPSEAAPCRAADSVIKAPRLTAMLGLRRFLETAHPRPPRLHQHRHVAGLVLVAPHLHMRARDVVPGEHFGHAGIDAALDDE